MAVTRMGTTSARGRNFGKTQTAHLPLSNSSETTITLTYSTGPRALECDDFPFEVFSDIAEMESWRKEINRPTTHIHKWWAQRLGTVFRAMVLGAFAPSGTDLFELFYKPVRIEDSVVFDPFMGSGTTIMEAVKSGARGIGRDINPVAHFLVKCALSVHNRKAILDTFHEIERDVAGKLRNYYRATLVNGSTADVLYYFWVKVIDCPYCASSVDLFSSMIFARHAYPKKYPRSQAVCPSCGGINEVLYDAKEALCSSCHNRFDPSHGPANGQFATCPSCAHSFSIANTVKTGDQPPEHRLYAKLVLLPDGTKTYLPATEEDHEIYAKAQQSLSRQKNPYPVVEIMPGYNTNQALGYNYRYWHQMFNARQLLCLSILADRIKRIDELVLRELFTCLFSGALEFNNMFASYKGEGTGAVRHMFAHHILKPERVPLEANLWGTPKSSGSFLTMFEGRIRRALDYADNPFELRIDRHSGKKRTQKVYGLSEKIGYTAAEDYASFADGKQVYLSCGDSSATDLPDGSVDTILTDPPFFDNVHYSQLADFFHVWQRHILGDNGHRQHDTTRSECEVQNAQADDFTNRLTGVWKEAHRVLIDDGLLAFTYHHSRAEGWRCVLRALMEAGFVITAAQPIKAEMSVAMPKQQAKEPIDIDIIIVCRKRTHLRKYPCDGDVLSTVTPVVRSQAHRLIASERYLSRSDVRVIVMAQILRQLSRMNSIDDAFHILDDMIGNSEALIEHVLSIQADKQKNHQGAK